MNVWNRTTILCLLAATFGVTAGWLKLSGRYSDSSLIDQEAASFGFSSSKDYQDFFALDKNTTFPTISDDQLALLSRVSHANPRYRALVLNIVGRETNEKDAIRSVPYIKESISDPEQKDSVDALAATWKEHGFKNACLSLEEARHAK